MLCLGQEDFLLKCLKWPTNLNALCWLVKSFNGVVSGNNLMGVEILRHILVIQHLLWICMGSLIRVGIRISQYIFSHNAQLIFQHDSWIPSVSLRTGLFTIIQGISKFQYSGILRCSLVVEDPEILPKSKRVRIPKFSKVICDDF